MLRLSANAWGFVSKLGKGLDTPIGEKGQRLSGGQRQRLALARAIYRDAPILLLDEPTSSLDAQSEKQVRQAIKNISHKRSILIVTHRLPTIPGIVPDNALARAFRDRAGRLHQRIAQKAERVVFLAAGLPLELKGKS